jgi:hypothetical protein
LINMEPIESQFSKKDVPGVTIKTS